MLVNWYPKPLVPAASKLLIRWCDYAISANLPDFDLGQAGGCRPSARATQRHATLFASMRTGRILDMRLRVEIDADSQLPLAGGSRRGRAERESAADAAAEIVCALDDAKPGLAPFESPMGPGWRRKSCRGHRRPWRCHALRADTKRSSDSI